MKANITVNRRVRRTAYHGPQCQTLCAILSQYLKAPWTMKLRSEHDLPLKYGFGFPALVRQCFPSEHDIYWLLETLIRRETSRKENMILFLKNKLNSNWIIVPFEKYYQMKHEYSKHCHCFEEVS